MRAPSVENDDSPLEEHFYMHCTLLSVFFDNSHQTISQKNKKNSIKHDILTRARIFSALEFSAPVKTSMSELNKYILRKKQLVCIIVE